MYQNKEAIDKKDFKAASISDLRLRLKQIEIMRTRKISFAVRYQLWDERDEIIIRIAVKRVVEEQNKMREFLNRAITPNKK